MQSAERKVQGEKGVGRAGRTAGPGLFTIATPAESSDLPALTLHFVPCTLNLPASGISSSSSHSGQEGFQ